MPEFDLDGREAAAIAGFLVSSSLEQRESVPPASVHGNVEHGAALFRSLGCFACHQIGGVGSDGPFAGGSLDGVGEKLSKDSIRLWLRRPELLNPDHRMPVFQLSAQELEDLASYLASLITAPREPAATAPDDPVEEQEMVRRGRELVARHGCAACHEIRGVEATPPKPLPSPLQDGRRGSGCLAQADRTRSRPGYSFDEPARQALAAFLNAVPDRPAPVSPFDLGRRLLRQHNCLGCHARDLAAGLQPAHWFRDDAPEVPLTTLRGELEPPSLTAVGDKFHNDILDGLIQGGLSPRRPWLKVRMPKFTHSEADRAAMLSFLIEHDRIPDGQPATRRTRIAPGEAAPHREPTPGISPAGQASNPKLEASLDPASALAAGHRLVSAQGFGCMSCHTVGKHQPRGIAVNARGSDLLAIGSRIRHAWFLRWMRDPARIVPGMEMPAISVPVSGLLGEQLDLQIEAIWQALNSPAFVVPSDRDSAAQIVAVPPGTRPAVLRDVMFDCPPGSGWCARSFAIGLPNQHNVLLDLDQAALRGWWYGDFARERTEGKTWLWEPAGLPIWQRPAAWPSIALRGRTGGRLLLPEMDRQSYCRIEDWENGAGRVELRYTMKFAGGISVAAAERIAPAQGDGRAGFARHFQVQGIPDDWEPVMVHGNDPAQAAVSNQLEVPGPLGPTTVVAPHGSQWFKAVLAAPDGEGTECYLVPFGIDAQAGPGAYRLDLTYHALLTAVPPKAAETRAGSEQPPMAAQRRGPQRLDVVPGFETVRLPLDPFVMPTAIAFRPDGTPVVCSLKGQVFLALDGDGDGFEDTWQPFTDHLAAPFGVLADGDAVIVSHKPELLRLEDRDRDGYAETSRVMATGWGYSEDYHDWTFGLVRDSQGRFYVTLGSDYQQAKRPTAARYWRGHALRIARDGTIDDLARGLRFSAGMAMNRDGQVFFSDNQGVQNTSNEINHLVPGSRYGVPALDDPPADQDPWPERRPAIEVPHPLTRSVNGLCFLEADGRFGPFEGHGIGCEYDTRALIRFSLQKVGDTYQGACYPFTVTSGMERAEIEGASQAQQGPLLGPANSQRPELLGPIACAAQSSGVLYVGGMRDSGWGGGNNVGELVRLRPLHELPLGIREVRAHRAGFVIDFTAPVDSHRAATPTHYSLSSYTRVWKGTYATADSERREERVRQIVVAPDRRSVMLELESLRAGHIYDIHVGSIGPVGQALWPAEASYTLNQVP
jgi:mono/diheme cytochrome c family protein